MKPSRIPALLLIALFLSFSGTAVRADNLNDTLRAFIQQFAASNSDQAKALAAVSSDTATTTPAAATTSSCADPRHHSINDLASTLHTLGYDHSDPNHHTISEVSGL